MWVHLGEDSRRLRSGQGHGSATMSATSRREVVASVSDRAPRLDRARYDVFVSYNRAEGPSVERIARRLREEGLAVFFDRWSTPGEPWQEELGKAISNAA